MEYKFLAQEPTFNEWFLCKGKVICDVQVEREDGEVQVIYDCDFNYSFDGVHILLSKKGWRIEDYFFVKRVLSDFNHRVEEA